ncbi:winged helix-turn-helix transcriptional regulator [Candidatus Saganbacteria bacterium]|uniref:Winged helix-turn-helix transcriptional regulator n=1 Tax=Candidatus Saganbacteria bacterium TaxID=2575572 RepID=A0A9D6UJT6_UNCSA|nr:winged helix-turn-helix transcriptional regulator [Candidatus Saganbacteria bacterium]
MTDEKEMRIIEEISRRSDLTQRELSARTRLSLGAVNIILKRMLRRGVIKTKSLTPRKVEYFLTPKGFSEKARKSYNYVLKTVNLVKMVREEIAKIILEEYNQGQKKFIVLGGDDLADIIELALKGFDYKRVADLSEIDDLKAMVFVGVKDRKVNGFRSINIHDRLGGLYWGTD